MKAPTDSKNGCPSYLLAGGGVLTSSSTSGVSCVMVVVLWHHAWSLAESPLYVIAVPLLPADCFLSMHPNCLRSTLPDCLVSMPPDCIRSMLPHCLLSKLELLDLEGKVHSLLTASNVLRYWDQCCPHSGSMGQNMRHNKDMQPDMEKSDVNSPCVETQMFIVYTIKLDG